MYCAWRTPAYLRCTQCSILLHLMDICFLTCICLQQISQIQTRLCDVVGPGLVSTSPAFVRSRASHPVHQVQRLIFSSRLVCGVVLGENEKIPLWVSNGQTNKGITYFEVFFGNTVDLKNPSPQLRMK